MWDRVRGLKEVNCKNGVQKWGRVDMTDFY